MKTFSAAWSQSKVRVSELDLLRFLAASAVMMYHFTYNLRLPGNSLDIFPTIGLASMYGYLGVNLFFMISGFVIVYTAYNRPPAEFVVSRITRLYPEFWIAVILSAIVFAYAGAHEITLPMVAANLTMIPQVFSQGYVDGVYWTLFIELKFYAILWVLSLARQMPRVESWMYLWLLITIYCFMFDAPGIVHSLTIYPYSPYFIAGCLFFLIRDSGPTLLRVVGILACLSLATIQVAAQMPDFVQLPDINTETILQSKTIIIIYFILFAVISIRKQVVIPFASTIVFLGMLTYPLYLVHNIGKVLILNTMVAMNPFVALSSAIIFSAGLASLLAFVMSRYCHKIFFRSLTKLIVRPRLASKPADIQKPLVLTSTTQGIT